MITKILYKLAKLSWFLPACLLWAAFPPLSERTNVFFAIAPLLWFARNKSPKESFKLWFLNGFLFWVATLSWMPAIIKNGGPWYLVVFGWSILAAYCALYFGAFGYLSSKMWQKAAGGAYYKRLLIILLAEPILWAGLELIRSRLLGGFAWNQLGVAAINSGFSAPAALGGVFLVSALVILINGTLASIVERMLEPWLAKRKRMAELAGASIELEELKGSSYSNIPRWVRSVETILPFVLVLGIFAFSKTYVRQTSSDSNVRELSVGLMQRNFPCVFKDSSEDPWEEYFSKSLQDIQNQCPDLLVLPESGFCEVATMLSNNNLPHQIKGEGLVYPNDITSYSAKEVAYNLMYIGNAKAVLAGGSRVSNDQIFNSAALYTREELVKSLVSKDYLYSKAEGQVYDKVHLVPFGEYIPGDNLIPALKDFAPVGSCTPGEPKLLELNGIKLGVAICYEDTDSALVRKFAAMGADALVFITNDSWFYGSVEPEQHAWQSIARAVETSLPIIRVGNSGVSGVVYPDGSFEWLTGKDGKVLVDESACKVVKVRLPEKGFETAYVRWGDMPLCVAFIMVMFVVFFGDIKSLFRRVVSR